MKKLLFAILLLSSCTIQINDEESRINEFVKKEKHPILVKRISYASENKDLTLISATGSILYIDYTTICLPDIIK